MAKQKSSGDKPPKRLREGWASVRHDHYFRNGRTLCGRKIEHGPLNGKWDYYILKATSETRVVLSVSCCCTCLGIRTKELLQDESANREKFAGVKAQLEASAEPAEPFDPASECFEKMQAADWVMRKKNLGFLGERLRGRFYVTLYSPRSIILAAGEGLTLVDALADAIDKFTESENKNTLKIS